MRQYLRQKKRTAAATLGGPMSLGGSFTPERPREHGQSVELSIPPAGVADSGSASVAEAHGLLSA